MEGYTPFKMKAKDYCNSPMLMNFPDSFPGGVGSSPAKGWFKNIAKKVKNLGKKVLGKTAIGKALGIGKEKKDPSMAAADATAVATQPHTHDETGAIVPEAEGPQPTAAEGVTGPQSVKAIKQGPRGVPPKPGTPEHAAVMRKVNASKFGRMGLGTVG